MKYLCLILMNINIIFTYIKLSFKTHKSDNYDYLFYNYLYINIDVGIPKQDNIKLVLKQSKYSFYLYNNNFFSNVSYISKSSSKYKALLNENFDLTSSNCLNGIFSKDTFFVDNQRIDNLTFILCTKSRNEEYKLFDGEIGLNLEYESPPNTNFIEALKINEIINNYIYSIVYVNDEEGFLLIGEYPHKINLINNIYDKYSVFKEENLFWVHSEISKNNFYYTLLFDKISYGSGEIYQAQREARISIEINYILSTPQYYKLFKDIFGRKCGPFSFENDLQGFRCSKDINIELTPEIKFYNKELNTTFILDYNDLYMEKDNYLYFLVVNYFDYEPGYWILGKPFLKKYLFLFDSDNKMIGFYKYSDNNDNNTSSNKISSYYVSIIMNVLLGIIVIILIFIFYHYIMKKRRIRANELEDTFNYTSKNDK